MRLHPPNRPQKRTRHSCLMAATGTAAATASSHGAPAAIGLYPKAVCSRREHGHLAAELRAATRWTLRVVVVSRPYERFERAIAILTVIFVDWHQRISLLEWLSILDQNPAGGFGMQKTDHAGKSRPRPLINKLNTFSARPAQFAVDVFGLETNVM